MEIPMQIIEMLMFMKVQVLIAVGVKINYNKGHASASIVNGVMSPSLGIYHYHNEPKSGCVYTDETGKHSPLFGIMIVKYKIKQGWSTNLWSIWR
jgi:hypothetical protein